MSACSPSGPRRSNRSATPKPRPGIAAKFSSPDIAKLAANNGNSIATDAIKSGNPALDAMAYAVGAPRESAVTTSEVVKSAHEAFDAAKASFVKAVATTGIADVKPLKPGPISVFISRKEGKLFVRKGFEPVFDAPVTFEQPDQPLGTHVFTALAINEDNTSFRWTVMSMPGGGPAPVKKSERGKKAEPPPPCGSSVERNRSAGSRHDPAGCARSDFCVDVTRRLADHFRQGTWLGNGERYGFHRADALTVGASFD